jgi:hypothetical protein
MIQRVWPTLNNRRGESISAIDQLRKTETARDTKEKQCEKLLLRRAKATVIIFFIFVCNRKISGKKNPLDGAGLTAMECDAT